jgi:hypothetical protein
MEQLVNNIPRFCFLILCTEVILSMFDAKSQWASIYMWDDFYNAFYYCYLSKGEGNFSLASGKKAEIEITK